MAATMIGSCVQISLDIAHLLGCLLMVSLHYVTIDDVKRP